MTKKQITYSIIAIIFLCALGLLVWAENGNKAIEFLAGIPLVGALVAVLIQVMRDQASYERALLTQDHQNRFVLGASSHMASVAFDKHVEFCEEYVREANEALHTIYREGPSQEALTHAHNLNRIRQKHAVWVTDRIENDLEPFERALRQMGASAGYVVSTTDNPPERGKLRTSHIDRMYKIFAEITGEKEWDGQVLTNELAVSSQIRYLRSVLGTEELNKMRQALVEKAVNELRD